MLNLSRGGKASGVRKSTPQSTMHLLREQQDTVIMALVLSRSTESVEEQQLVTSEFPTSRLQFIEIKKVEP